jgi:ankyrin repeat protein
MLLLCRDKTAPPPPTRASPTRPGDLAGIKDLVENEGADVNAPGANDRTALHRAAGAAQLEVLQYLLKVGAALDARDR